MDYEKSKIKLTEDGFSYQKVMEILFLEYMKNNKKIMEVLSKYKDSQEISRKSKSLDNLEIDQLRKLMEEEHSPLRFIEKISDEVKQSNDK